MVHDGSLIASADVCVSPKPLFCAGTNYPRHMWDPHDYGTTDYYDQIALAQARAEEERSASQSSAHRSAVPFASAGQQSVSTFAPSAQGGLMGAAQFAAAQAAAIAAAASGRGGATVGGNLQPHFPARPSQQPHPAVGGSSAVTAAVAAAREAANAAAATNAGPGSRGTGVNPSAGAGAAGGQRSSRWDSAACV